MYSSEENEKEKNSLNKETPINFKILVNDLIQVAQDPDNLSTSNITRLYEKLMSIRDSSGKQPANTEQLCNYLHHLLTKRKE